MERTGIGDSRRRAMTSSGAGRAGRRVPRRCRSGRRHRWTGEAGGVRRVQHASCCRRRRCRQSVLMAGGVERPWWLVWRRHGGEHGAGGRSGTERTLVSRQLAGDAARRWRWRQERRWSECAGGSVSSAERQNGLSGGGRSEWSTRYTTRPVNPACLCISQLKRGRLFGSSCDNKDSQMCKSWQPFPHYAFPTTWMWAINIDEDNLKVFRNQGLTSDCVSKARSFRGAQLLLFYEYRKQKTADSFNDINSFRTGTVSTRAPLTTRMPVRFKKSNN